MPIEQQMEIASPLVEVRMRARERLESLGFTVETQSDYSLSAKSRRLVSRPADHPPGAKGAVIPFGRITVNLRSTGPDGTMVSCIGELGNLKKILLILIGFSIAFLGAFALVYFVHPNHNLSLSMFIFVAMVITINDVMLWQFLLMGAKRFLSRFILSLG